MIAAAELGKDDIVLEIGAGFGTLTSQLAEKAKHVLAVELEKRVIPALKNIQKAYPNISIIEQDARLLNPKEITRGQPYKVVANIPFNITSLLIKNLLAQERPPVKIVLLVQKELAQRIVNKPPHASLLSISVEFFAQAKVAGVASKNCFWPEPKVDAAIIVITPRQRYLSRVDPKNFFQIVKAGFSQKRKQLKNSLAAGLRLDPSLVAAKLKEINIDSAYRGQQLAVDEWIKITNHFKDKLAKIA